MGEGSGGNFDVPHNETDVTDTQLERKLNVIGAVLPEGQHFKGIFSTKPDVRGLHALNIVGTPLYLYSDFAHTSEKERLMRLHEMSHGFIQTHLIPQQSVPGVRYEDLTDAEMESLAATSWSDQPTRDLKEDIKLMRLEKGLNDYRDNPAKALENFTQQLDSLRERDARIRDLYSRRGRPYNKTSIEATAAGVVQNITADLRNKTYSDFGNIHQIIDFEEALATYLSHHALHASTTAGWSFDQGERAKSMALDLGTKYPDPTQVTSIIRTDGMKGFLEQNAAILVKN